MTKPISARRSRLIWGVVGLFLAAGMLLPAVHTVGSFVLVLAIVMPFLVWHWYGGAGSWMGMITMGVTMTAVLAAALIVGFGCPPKGATVELKAGKPPVGCSEVRASYMSMAVFFGFVALIGAVTPTYLRRMPPADDPS